MVFSYCGQNLDTLHFAAVASGHLQHLPVPIAKIGLGTYIDTGKQMGGSLKIVATKRLKRKAINEATTLD